MLSALYAITRRSVSLSVTGLSSVGIDLKELGGQLPKCMKFCPGIEIWSRFSLKNGCL